MVTGVTGASSMARTDIPMPPKKWEPSRLFVGVAIGVCVCGGMAFGFGGFVGMLQLVDLLGWGPWR